MTPLAIPNRAFIDHWADPGAWDEALRFKFGSQARHDMRRNDADRAGFVFDDLHAATVSEGAQQHHA